MKALLIILAIVFSCGAMAVATMKKAHNRKIENDLIILEDCILRYNNNVATREIIEKQFLDINAMCPGKRQRRKLNSLLSMYNLKFFPMTDEGKKELHSNRCNVHTN